MAYLSPDIHWLAELDTLADVCTLAEVCRLDEVHSHCTMCCFSLERAKCYYALQGSHISCQRTIFVGIRSSEVSVNFY